MKCSVPDFVKLFDSFLQQAKAKLLDSGTHKFRSLGHVGTILSKAVDPYNSWIFYFCLWNFEKEGCSANKCLQPTDQKIAANRKKFSEQNQNAGGTMGGNTFWKEACLLMW